MVAGVEFQPIPTDQMTIDPLEFQRLVWPSDYFYDKQREIIYSVCENDETVVPAGNMLGKDFVAAFIILYFFMSRYPCRIVTTSVREEHLGVLWGEMNDAIYRAKVALRVEDGGPLIVNHREIKRYMRSEKREAPLCYIKGMVAGNNGQGLSGHHIKATGDGVPRTLLVVDEASGTDEIVYTLATAWANRILGIGNCWQCENWFKYAVTGRPGTDDRGGDIARDYASGYHRKVIRITAEDSPNVRFARAQQKAGIEPDNRIIVPGVKSWGEYQRNRKLWDAERQCVGLDAMFYEGAEIKMFPKTWLEIAELLGQQTRHDINRRAKGIGVDTAEGGDNTSMCAVDADGVIDLISKKTPDTSEIPNMVLEFMKKWHCKPEDVVFDRGGGGYQHVSVLNKMGFKVRSVAFGETVTAANHWKYFHTMKEKQMEAEEKTIYKNRRAELYGTLRDVLNPAYETGFGIDTRFVELFQQLTPIPLWWEDGKLTLPPKSAKPGSKNPEDQITLVKLIGHSPDEADSLVLAVYAMTHKPPNTMLGSMV